MSCPHCDAKIPLFGPNLHIESTGDGYRFEPCHNPNGNPTPDCYVYLPDRKAAANTLASSTAGRLIGGAVLALLAFTAVLYFIQQY